MSFLDKLFPVRQIRLLKNQLKAERNRYQNRLGSITAANGGGGRGGRGSWMGMPDDEDAANKEYATDRAAIMQRSQDLDVNNPDVGGFARTRVAQILGAGVHFRHAARAEELNLTEDQALKIAAKIDRLRQKHSENGGFDAQKCHEWEGERQERAFLTALVYGQCLIHRVWRPRPGALLPLALELIPGSRISTPYEEQGNPLVSHGVKYTDARRTQVVGYYVRRVSESRGDSFVPIPKWDLLPIEDCSVIGLVEPAGIDQPLPLCTRAMRMLKNRGEFLENTVESARAQSAHYAAIKCAPGVDPYTLAADDRSADTQTAKTGAIDLGGGVRAIYLLNGEEMEWSSAKLPEPQFDQFVDKTDERLARGFLSSKSRFTRVVGNSFAGGRLEDQQDEPIVDQYRRALRTAWHKVNGWFLEAIWLTGAIELPGYNATNRHLWNEFHAEFPGKPDINPTDTANAREKNLMLRQTTPQREIEKSGADPRTTVHQWAQWVKLVREKEKEFDLPEGSLDILFSGKAVTTQAGEDVGAPQPDSEPDPNDESGNAADKGQKQPTKKKSNK